MPEDNKEMENMVEVLVTHGTYAYGNDTNLTGVAAEWLDEGFSPDDADQWLAARCFEATSAAKFRDAGLEPEDVDFKTTAGTGGYTDTLAYKVSNGDLKADNAIRIAKSRK